MLKFLINASFGGPALIKGRCLIESSAFSDPSAMVLYLVASGAYLRPGVYQREYGNKQ